MLCPLGHLRSGELGLDYSFGSGQCMCVLRNTWLCGMGWFQKWVTNMLYDLFPAFLDIFTNLYPKALNLSNLRCSWLALCRYAFRISKVFLSVILFWKGNIPVLCIPDWQFVSWLYYRQHFISYDSLLGSPIQISILKYRQMTHLYSNVLERSKPYT